MPRVVIYSTRFCGYCVAAKRFFEDHKKVEVEMVDLTTDPQGRAELVQRTGRRTVPQIFVGETHIGGYTDLRALDSAGELDELLAG